MRHLFRNSLSLAATALLLVGGNASAVEIFCPDNATLILDEYERQASVDPALACEFGIDENPDGDTFFGGGWDAAGELNGADGTNGSLTVEVTSGSWGAGDVTADWFIDAGFWDLFGSAVISAHVGQGQGDPDWFAWTIPTGTLSGIFTYDVISGAGGGLSNIKLWGRDTPDITVPEPSVIALLGIGLLVAGVTGRRRRSLS